MHNYENYSGVTRKSIENHYIGMWAETDPGETEPYQCTKVYFLDKEFKNEADARSYVEDQAYWSYTEAVAVRVVSGKKTKALLVAEKRLKDRQKDYETFKKNLTFGYGRKSKTFKCPDCGSIIAIKPALLNFHGDAAKYCPICKSKKVISDSNWEILNRKRRLLKEAEDALSIEENKSKSYWVACFAWHS